MDDLLKITNKMVSTINNTSDITNIENTTIWKSPTQNQQEKVDEIHQQFLESQTWDNNLTQETTTYIMDKKPTKPTHKPIKPTHKPIKPTHKPIKPTHKPTKPTHKPIKPTHKPTKPTHKPGNMPTKPKDVIIKDHEKNEYSKRGSKVTEIIKKTWEILDTTLNKVEQILNIVQSLDSMFKLGIFNDSQTTVDKIVDELEDYIKNHPGNINDENIEEHFDKELTNKVKELVLINFKENLEIIENQEIVDYLVDLTVQRLLEINDKEPSEELILSTINAVFDDPDTWGSSYLKSLTTNNKIKNKQLNDNFSENIWNFFIGFVVLLISLPSIIASVLFYNRNKKNTNNRNHNEIREDFLLNEFKEQDNINYNITNCYEKNKKNEFDKNSINNIVDIQSPQSLTSTGVHHSI